MSELAKFYFAHDDMLLIPVEAMSEQGVERRFREELERHGLSADWVAGFDASLRTYVQRGSELAAAAPRSWLPPRIQNACIVRRGRRVRPYYQPFFQNSWVLYEEDFGAGPGPCELGIFAIIFSEKLSLLGSLGAAAVASLSYFLRRSEAETQRFRQRASETGRPDAAVIRRIADHLVDVPRIFHDELRPPQLEIPGGYTRIDGPRLVVPSEDKAGLQSLLDACDSEGGVALRAYYDGLAPSQQGAVRAAGQGFVDFLRTHRPRVLIVDASHDVLWDPDEPGATDRIFASVDGAEPEALRSLQADLQIVSEKTKAFLDALVDPAMLAKSHRELDEGGGTFIHSTRDLIVYSLAQPGLDPLREPAPPYHRLLLAARVIHEWGHLAVDAGAVYLPDSQREVFDALRAELRERFMDLVESCPTKLKPLAARDVSALLAEEKDLTDIIIGRMDDYKANRLSRRFLEAAELESYIRANVRSLAKERSGPFIKLARYLYEFQYLRLGLLEDPLTYFMRCTWFRPHFVERGLLTEQQFQELVDVVARLCELYVVDGSKVRGAT